MGNHITYLFGGGPSYEAMPIQNEFAMEMRILSALLKERKLKQNTISGYEIPKVKADPIFNHNDILGNYASESLGFYSIDTLARILDGGPNQFDNGKLKELKQAVDIYFTYRHFFQSDIDITLNPLSKEENPSNTDLKTLQLQIENLNRKPTLLNISSDRDKRIVHLLANFIKQDSNQRSIIENVNFLTWNYDLLLDIAFLELTTKNGRYTSKEAYENLPILHLNGKASVPLKDEINSIRGQEYDGPDRLDEGDFLSRVLHKGGKDIHYAWSSTNRNKDIIKFIEKTTHLVIIGYSYPFFNRKIDRLILEAPNLKKVYIQDREKALDGIENRVKALLGNRGRPFYWRPGHGTNKNYFTHVDQIPKNIADVFGADVEIERINSTDQFHIPFEIDSNS